MSPSNIEKPGFPIYNPGLDGSPFFLAGGDTGVLLIHGFTATTAEVRPLAQALNRQGYTISGPLLPGHNTHPQNLNQVRWQDWVQAVENAYHELSTQCGHVFLGGESTGGLLSLYLASQHPEAVGLLLYAPALRLSLKPWEILSLHLLAPVIPYRPKASLGDTPLWQGYPVNPLKGTLQLLKLQQQVLPLLAKIRQPILIVQGRLDSTVHPTVPAKIAQDVQSSTIEIHWMTHSRHCVLLEDEREPITGLTMSFMQKCLAPKKVTG